MDSVFDAHAIDIALEPLPVGQCPDGPVSTGLAVLARTDAYEVGVWEHAAGRSTDIETDEVFVVISGSGRVLLENGDVLELAPGTVGVLYAGTRTTWVIDEPLRKVWIVER
ncbi:MAG: cupin domain-containing protein [Candidatus Nanopelagicales bacterium]|nr:cupin domain-containing protein [Candidatus Nanopelagicales bacterium]MCF8537734.1 cupin domain-containing protein [Candidatus Nanopelagicales bacterium]MCF8557866.1 cupin domain-containing protein [Candidatus Nanopelagicales bacterium]